MSGVRVSAVVTAHDAADTIGACVRALASQRGFADGEMEIILVDDRSGDDTERVARATGVARLDLVTIARYDGGPLTARQLALDAGVRRARGRVIIVTDADARPSADWASRLVAPIERGAADVVAGGVAFVAARSGVRAALLAALQTADVAFYLAVCAALARVGLPSGMLFGSAAFTREAFLSLGGFAGVGPALTEDLAFARAAHDAALRLAFVPTPAVSVGASGSWRELARRARRTSAGGASVLAAVLGAWMALPVGLAALSAFGLASIGWLLGRYLAGVAIVAAALVRAGRPRLAWVAPFYEPFAIVTGLRVLWSLRRSSDVDWGGVTYRRAAPRARTRIA